MSTIYMLDTNICSFIMRERPPAVLDRLQAAVEQQNSIVISVITYYEMLLGAAGKNAFQLDSRPPSIPLEKYVYNEGRYAMLARSSTEAAAILLEEAQRDVNLRWKLYEHWASFSCPNGGSEA